MASKTRIPKAEITGIYGGLLKMMTRKMLGYVPESVGADFLAANPDAVRLLQWEYLNPLHTRQAAPAAAFDEAVVVAKRALRRSGYAGIDARLLMLSIVGMCFFPFGYARTARRSPAFLAAYKKHVVRLLIKGITGK